MMRTGGCVFPYFDGKEVEDKNGKKEIRAPYGKVKSWFLKKYPNYQELLDEATGIKSEDQKQDENNDTSADTNGNNILNK